MKHLLIVGALLLTLPASATAGNDRQDASAAAYEHLATAILEMRATEDRLVESILNGYFDVAMQQLGLAVSEGMVGDHAKAAADEITAIANEGNKRVQAVRQKLLKGGHHHHTDAVTEDDYIWIDSSEKKELLDLAGMIAKTKDAGMLAARKDELSELFASAMKPE